MGRGTGWNFKTSEELNDDFEVGSNSTKWQPKHKAQIRLVVRPFHTIVGMAQVARSNPKRKGGLAQKVPRALQTNLGPVVGTHLARFQGVRHIRSALLAHW